MLFNLHCGSVDVLFTFITSKFTNQTNENVFQMKACRNYFVLTVKKVSVAMKRLAKRQMGGRTVWVNRPVRHPTPSRKRRIFSIPFYPSCLPKFEWAHRNQHTQQAWRSKQIVHRIRLCPEGRHCRIIGSWKHSTPTPIASGIPSAA